MAELEKLIIATIVAEFKKSPRQCVYPTCNKTGIYSETSEIEYCTYCCNHRPSDDYVNIQHKRCDYISDEGERCDKIPNYGKDGIKTCCSDHVKDGDVLINGRQCAHPECKSTANYGSKETKIKMWCSKHKQPGDVILNVKLCTIEDCGIVACFGNSHDGKVLWCEAHKKPDDINLKAKLCQADGCKIKASFSNQAKGYPMYCGAHCPDNTFVDIISTKCSHPGCDIRSGYNYPGLPAKYCKEHANFRMVRHPYKFSIEPDMKCEDCGGLVKNTEIICSECETPIPIINAKINHPKEKEIKALLESMSITFIHNRPIQCGNRKYRPDFLIEIPAGYIVLEVDEEQHKRSGYDGIAELERMIAIRKALNKNTLFIRYNPDAYICANKPKNRKEFLKLYLRTYVQFPILNELMLIKFFYDGFNPDDMTITFIEDWRKYTDPI